MAQQDASSPTGEPVIAFAGVTKRFGPRDGAAAVTAVQDLDIRIGKGEVVALIGPSGCGKSTLLNMGAGLYRPSSGNVFVAGRPVTKPNPTVGFMLQKDLLMPWRTIRQNIELGLELRGMAAAARTERSTALLARVQLAEFASHHPHQLSGGMRQRAALARTLALAPTVLLLDEPFSALDAQTKMVLQEDLAQLIAQEAITALFITHDLAEAVVLSDRVLVMSERPGRIIREIVVDLPYRDRPLERRLLPKVGHYVSELMSLLKIGAGALSAH